MMKARPVFSKRVGLALLLAGLVLLLAVAPGQPGFLALAQEPDQATPDETGQPAVELTVTPEPTDEVTEPEPTDEAAEPEPTDEAAEPEPTDEGAPLGDPADTGVIDPPDEAELGPAVNEAGYVGGDDVQDKEGGVVDIFDLAFVASHFGSQNPAADLNQDGKVDIFDLSILAAGYNQAGPVAAAAVAAPEPLPVVETGVEEFGALDLAVDSSSQAAEVEAAAVMTRSLKIGVGINYARAFDPTDPQTRTPPDLYAVVSVGGVRARTATIWNRYEVWPNWRLGWWRYASFPWTDPNGPDASMNSAPINLELRDDDGWICYGYYGCWPQYERLDISQVLSQRIKMLQFYPSACKVKDENGVQTNGSWLDSARTRCRVPLQAWGTEWPRGYMSYFIEGVWE